ncbi:MAG TPA: hypothetical protein VEH04_07195 [Verrucomicrobiae bacterium]|nr:hypothetical protein [Verrucomicrobiae bacterium]
MSEFKFACPVCGQHITADSRTAGSQLDCPTCFRSLVIPQPPSASDSKLVITASEVSRQRAGFEGTVHSPAAAPRRRFWLFRGPGIAAIAILSITATAALLMIGGHLPLGTRTADKVDHDPAVADLSWQLDLSQEEIPPGPARGRIKGGAFVCERAVFQGGTLNLRMGKEWPPDLGISIHLYARNPEELAGRSAVVNSNNIRSPRVVLRWKEEGKTRTETFTNGFAMRLEFGQQEENQLPGKIYICTPDSERSLVAGIFHAEIRRPAPRYSDAPR